MNQIQKTKPVMKSDKKVQKVRTEVYTSLVVVEHRSKVQIKRRVKMWNKEATQKVRGTLLKITNRLPRTTTRNMVKTSKMKMMVTNTRVSINHQRQILMMAKLMILQQMKTMKSSHQTRSTELRVLLKMRRSRKRRTEIEILLKRKTSLKRATKNSRWKKNPMK